MEDQEKVCPIEKETMNNAVSALYQLLESTTAKTKKSKKSKKSKKKKEQVQSDNQPQQEEKEKEKEEEEKEKKEEEKAKETIKQQLFDNEEIGQAEDKTIFLQLAFKKIPHREKFPIPLDLPYSQFGKQHKEPSVCVFLLGQEQKDKVKEQMKINQVTAKVITLESLRKKYQRYEQRRHLARRFDIYLCDKFALTFLSPLLGVNFFKWKKFPIPLHFGGKKHLPDFIALLKKAQNITAFRSNSGTTNSIPIGSTSSPQEELLANLQSVLDQLELWCPQGWPMIRSLHLKTRDSTSIPFYASLIEYSGLDNNNNNNDNNNANNDKEQNEQEQKNNEAKNEENKNNNKNQQKKQNNKRKLSQENNKIQQNKKNKQEENEEVVLQPENNQENNNNQKSKKQIKHENRRKAQQNKKKQNK